MSGKWKVMALSTAAAVGLVLALSGTVAASGSGYNLSYSQTSTVSPGAVAINAVSTSYTSGPNLTTSFTTNSAIDLTDFSYDYFVWFGGTTAGNASAGVSFSNNSTAGFYYQYSGGGGSSGAMPFAISNGGDTLSFSIATALVGTAGSFAVDVEAVYAHASSYAFSWLGSYYGPGGGGGGGSCGPSGCSSTGTGAAFAWGGILLYGILAIVVVVVIIIVVVVVVMRGKRPPAGAPPSQPGWMPGQVPGMAPPPPSAPSTPMMPPPPPR